MEPDSRNLYRNHERACPHREKKRKFKRCRCPIWVDFTVAGERTCRSLRTRDWTKADAWLRTWENEDTYAEEGLGTSRAADSSDTMVRQSPKTIEATCTALLADLEARELSDATRYKFSLLLRRLLVFAEKRGFRYITELTVEPLREFRATWPHHGTAARKRLEELRGFFRFCKDSGWIAENPAKSLRPPKVISPPTEPFTDEEVERIRAACAIYPDGLGRAHQAHARQLRALVELMLHTGLRIGDAVMLRRDSIVAEKLRVRTEKTGTEVFCPLPEWVVRVLAAVRGTSTQYFFWSGQSKAKSAVGDWQRALKKLFKLAGVVDGHAHRFRHTFAKRLLMARVPVETVAVLMGHRSPAITIKHYSAWVRERQEQLEASVARVWENGQGCAERGKRCSRIAQRARIGYTAAIRKWGSLAKLSANSRLQKSGGGGS